MVAGLRSVIDSSGGAPLDEFAPAGAWQKRFLAAEGGALRGKGQTIPVDNKEAEKREPVPGYDSAEGQLLRDNSVGKGEGGGVQDVRDRFQQADISPGGHRGVGGIIKMIAYSALSR